MKMKKYHQLLLLILSIISLSLFLIYRQEYNRLHNVLEVFNFFGQPCNFSELQRAEIILNHHDWGPEPTWQEMESGYIYSAFLTGKIEVKALALQSDMKRVPRNCYLWFEEKKKPIVGMFKFSKLVNDDRSIATALYYICTLPKIENIPYAVSFSNKIKKESDMKKIMLLNTLNHNPSFNTTICVSPSMYSKKRLLEFISFHKLIGIDSFIFYEKDIPHRISKFISNIANRLDIHAAFLPWNYPKQDSSLVRMIVESDCLMRTFGQSRYTTTLEINEYIVPLETYGFDSLIKTLLGENLDKLSLPVQKFCIESLEINLPIALQNFNVIDDSSFNVVRFIHKNNVNNEVVSTSDRTHGSIHKYVRCNVNPRKTHVDRSITKYSEDFIRTTLVQLLIHDQV